MAGEGGCESAEVLARCMARLYAGGLTTSSGGNLSTVDGAGTLWITPRGTDKGALAAADVVALAPPWAAPGPAAAAPSTELPLHRRIYAARPAVRAVLHAHPPALVASAVAGVVPATGALAAAAARCGTLRHIPYAMPGTEALAQLVCDAFSEAATDDDDVEEEKRRSSAVERGCFVLMGHHGVVAGGATLPGLLAGLEALECAATVLVHARQLAALSPGFALENTAAATAFPADTGRCYARAVRDALADSNAKRVRERTEDEERCREAAEQLVAFARRLAQQRLAPANAPCALSVRLDARHVLCSDCATPLCALDARTLVVLDTDTLAWHSAANKSSDSRSAPPHWRCSTVHAAVYRQHARVGAVLSSEGVPCVLAFAAARCLCAAPPFAPAAIPEGLLALRTVAAVPGAAALAAPARVAAALDPRTAPVCVAAHDCVHTVGATLLQAYDRLEVAEALARSQCLCAALGTVPASLPPADVAALEAAYPPPS